MVPKVTINSRPKIKYSRQCDNHSFKFAANQHLCTFLLLVNAIFASKSYSTILMKHANLKAIFGIISIGFAGYLLGSVTLYSPETGINYSLVLFILILSLNGIISVLQINLREILDKNRTLKIMYWLIACALLIGISIYATLHKKNPHTADQQVKTEKNTDPK